MPTARRPIGAKDAGTPAPAPEKNPKAAADMPPAEPVPAAAPAAEPIEPAPSPETVDPVDTQSPDYQAGYNDGLNSIDTGSANFEAGYAAGLGDGGAKSAEPAAAPEAAPAEPPAAGRPATATELLKAFGDDKGFCMDQLAVNATMAAAYQVRCGLLAERLKAAETRAIAAEERAAKAERALDAETASPAPVRTAGREASAAPTASSFEKIEDSKERAKAEWAANHGDCKKSFVDEKTYVAFRSVDLRRGVTVHKPGTSA
jgi:hypothetical protein